MSDIKYVNANTREQVGQQNGTDYTPMPGDMVILNNQAWEITEVHVKYYIECYVKPK